MEGQPKMSTSSKIQILENKYSDLTRKCEELMIKTLKCESKARILTGSINALKRKYAILVIF